MTTPVSRDPSFPVPPAPAPAPVAVPRASPDPAQGPSPFARLLSGLGQRIEQGERLVRQTEASRPSELGAPELIALQVGVCRYSETVDLAARLVDHASSAVKTVVEGQ